jgi:hypothetical protein
MRSDGEAWLLLIVIVLALKCCANEEYTDETPEEHKARAVELDRAMEDRGW